MGKNRNKHKKSQSKKPLDIVVTTAGRYDLLVKCLESLEKQTVKTFNILLIDGNEDLAERNKHRELFEKYNAKLLSVNVGYPKLANTGARMGKAPLILFLSDDVMLKEDAIGRMLKVMEDEAIGVLGTKLLFPEDSIEAGRPAGKVQHIGLAMDVEANVIHPLVGWSTEHPKCNVSRQVFGVTGASLLIRRNLFIKIGGFDTAYGMGTFEDVDLCVATRKQGKMVVINTDIVGYHHVGATVKLKKMGFPLQENRNVFRAKWQSEEAFGFDSWSFY